MIPSDPFGGAKKVTGAAAGPSFTNETSAPAPDKTSTQKKNEALGQQEFLLLLVNQLQQQDPLNPLDPQQFAAQLAQFSSLEQLIAINKKLDTNTAGPNSMGTMAAFLGHEVALGDTQVKVSEGTSGSNLLVDIPKGTHSLRVDFVNDQGQIVGSKVIDEFNTGDSLISLQELSVPNGSYDVRVISVTENGRFSELAPKITGTVEGFVLEPEPALLVSGREVALTEVKEVYAGSATKRGTGKGDREGVG